MENNKLTIGLKEYLDERLETLASTLLTAISGVRNSVEQLQSITERVSEDVTKNSNNLRNVAFRVEAVEKKLKPRITNNGYQDRFEELEVELRTLIDGKVSKSVKMLVSLIALLSPLFIKESRDVILAFILSVL